MARKVGRLHAARAHRLAHEVAPLVAQGKSIYEIAKKLHISPSTASHDVAAVRQLWAKELETDMTELRAKAIQEYAWLAKEAVECWSESRDTGKPADRLLTAASAILKEKNKLMGLGLDVNLVQNNLAIHGEATAAEVTQVFAPMDPKDYDAFISQRGAMTQLPPIPEEGTADNPENAIQRGAGDNDWGVSAS